MGRSFFAFNEEESACTIVKPDEGAVLLDVGEPAVVEGPVFGRDGNGGQRSGFPTERLFFGREMFDGEFALRFAYFDYGVSKAMFAEGGDELIGGIRG